MYIQIHNIVISYTRFHPFWKFISLVEKSSSNEAKCWLGYSPALGDFKGEDKADTCHYGHLYHNAIMHLKTLNKNNQLSLSSGEFAETKDYIMFLSEHLDQRRINDKITVNIELGKNEFYRLNYQAAQQYFEMANEILASSSNPNPKIVAEIATYTESIHKALN